MSRIRQCVIVDDVRAYRLQIRSWLGSLGFECTEYSRVKDAWKAICQRRTDMIVTDIDMPQISGLQLIRAVRSSELDGFRFMPIIAISGLCDPDIDRFIRQIGASRFIPKPLNKDDFETAVAQVMSEDPQTSLLYSPQTESLPQDFPRISPVLRRLAREAVEEPTPELACDTPSVDCPVENASPRDDGTDDTPRVTESS